MSFPPCQKFLSIAELLGVRFLSSFPFPSPPITCSSVNYFKVYPHIFISLFCIFHLVPSPINPIILYYVKRFTIS